MKKLLAMFLVLGMASLANATIMDVVIVGSVDEFGDPTGRDGTKENPFVESDIIEIAIVTGFNQYTYSGGQLYPAYDGPLISSLDLDLHVTGPGDFSIGLNLKGTLPAPDVHPNLNPWEIIGESSAGLERFGGAATNPIGPGQVVLGNLFIHCTGADPVFVDLTWAGGASEYSEFGGALNLDWQQLTEADLGDLMFYQPEPMTMALLGVGGLLIRRRRR